MKFILLIVCNLFFQASITAQSRIELYKSALGNSTSIQIPESQLSQMEAQLIKNEQLDAGLNFFYLKGNLPINQKIKEEYNAQRVIRALTNNNYLSQLANKLRDFGVSNYMISTFISSDAGSFIVNDINKNYINSKVVSPDSIKNIQYYYRLLQINKSYNKYFENDVNYSDLWENQVRLLAEEVLNYSENLTLEKEESIPNDIFKTVIGFQSLTNGLGNEQLLNMLENSTVKLLQAYDELIKKHGKGNIKNGHFAFLDIFSGFKFSVGYNYIIGLEQNENYLVEKNEFTSSFEINQYYNSNQFISLDFEMSAFYLFPRKSFFSKSRLIVSLGISNPLYSTYTENSLNEQDKYVYYERPQYKSVAYKDLYTKSSSVPIKIYTTYGFTVPIYEIANWGYLETGSQFILSLYSSKSKFKYFVQTDGENKESGEKFRIITNYETPTYTSTQILNEFNVFVKYRSNSFYGFQNEVLIGNAISYIRLHYVY